MRKQRLLSEIIKYSKKYEEELKRSGMNDDETAKFTKKWIEEVYDKYQDNAEESIKKFEFYNLEEQQKIKTR